MPWVTTPVTAGTPRVSVPVLSKTTVSIARAVSSASASRKRTPRSAAAPMPTITAVGVARPSAQGQAMMSTEMKVRSAKVSAGGGPTISQTAKAVAARMMTAGVK